ncbi:MAG: hypothetical protein KJ649_11660 [Proteobacteria bacterium]|nr:hypothetical protein [Pseudomonadota bacterium]MBU1964197.1 hypothetical protein [Pseudomonadota bacterium]
MKKTVVIVLAAVMVSAVGCKKSEEAGKVVAPQVAARSIALPAAVPPAVPPPGHPSVAPQAAAPQAVAGIPVGGDPHAGLKLKEMAAGTGHKGKVLQVMEAGSYIYVEVEEKGKKLWVAALKVKAAKGDTVEFPDSPPMEKFHSKTLNRTFDKILFVESLRIVK